MLIFTTRNAALAIFGYRAKWGSSRPFRRMSQAGAKCMASSAMEMPTSLAASAPASFKPSPTMATCFPFLCQSSTKFNLSLGLCRKRISVEAGKIVCSRERSWSPSPVSSAMGSGPNWSSPSLNPSRYTCSGKSHPPKWPLRDHPVAWAGAWASVSPKYAGLPMRKMPAPHRP